MNESTKGGPIMLPIGSQAPEWSSEAFLGGELRELSSTDLAGRWYVLYWYPLDFTAVCPTEIQGFQRLLPEFEADGVAVLGASTDSFYSHQRWFADRNLFPEPITHPVLADTSHRVTRTFGVLDPNRGIAYRATVVVDPAGAVRSLSVNDVQVARSPAEVLRTVQALISGGLCGADWRPGDRFAA